MSLRGPSAALGISARGSDAAQTPQLDKILEITQLLVQSSGIRRGWPWGGRSPECFESSVLLAVDIEQVVDPGYL